VASNPEPVLPLPAGAERIATRREQLAGETVVVERLKVDCSRRADGLLMPRAAPPAGAQALPVKLPEDCAEEVERIWAPSSGSPRLIGAYPVRGVQLMASGVVRRFTSTSRLVDNQVVITDDARWYWLSGAWKPGAKPGSVEEELLGEAKTTTQRVYRLEHERLAVVRAQIEAEPARGTPQQAWLATSYATSRVCGAGRRSHAP